MKEPHWKQATPKDQAVAILAGVEGVLDNLNEGVCTPARAVELIKPLLGDLKILHHETLREFWDLCPRHKHEPAEGCEACEAEGD
jgi:hypothetical protein